MDDHVIDRLQHVLLKHKKRLGSWSRLADAIGEANDRRRERHIDRRTLKNLCGEKIEEVQLRVGQLLALDHFFNLNNEDPLLTKSLSPISSIAESINVNFLLAARDDPARKSEAIARWDLRALTRLMRTRLNSLNMRIWDVEGADSWRKDDQRIANSANVAIGSPVANYASEELLARMVGVAPQEKCGIDTLPFFVVAAARDKDVKSAFVRDRREALHIDAQAVKTLGLEQRGIVLGNQFFATTESRDFALLVAQRSPTSGQAQMVLCGLTGPGTYQLARILQSGQPAQTLPPVHAGEERPPMLVALYELTLVPDEQARGRNTHRVVSYAPAAGPAFLHHLRDKWRFVQSDGMRVA